MKVTVLKGKAGLHQRNLHRGRYDFSQLVKVTPELKRHVVKNPKGEASINFSDPVAVKLLNKALLVHHYGIVFWDIPEGYLCPPIPGRADYIHRLAELLVKDNKQINHEKVRALDVGVGANCIYPIIAATQYRWQCVGSDIDPVSIENANQIVESNAELKPLIECRLQTQRRYFFKGIIQSDEYFELTTCNPPFHRSLQEAQQGTERKINNLNRSKQQRGLYREKEKYKASPILNFGGQNAELWCPGGEAAFIKNLAFESRDFAKQVLWFSTLISKKENVRWMRKNLAKVGAKEVQIVEMSQGHKVSRFMAWTFQTPAERQGWYSSKQ
ncbi:23S rRNA (adenine(1618)-N(6))-methyltransferase RlmF [Vibrio sp. Isolate25]|uniref:23S rRNA (adenine(1618)-N(6))-methyltransferase RlmF n=1 Tax=Vibrio sp. Isolate25 TaxID=2908535 RepID=UPI001EFE26BD|nr:23S rRNA (adenine(1618)-N(6))-methyltransferase RlmF [Vibrio sp. Isolate25]MCG9597349.1 23S rRNA (adenine(1618)-N(6))-methyltransferase RlmF [Vibrio sp. Isolate25]